jgi:glycosyltransferase 2 family protein
MIIIMVFYLSFAIYSDATKFITHVWKINVKFILPILISFSVTVFIKAIRQLHLLKTIDVNVELKQNFLIYFAGLSMLATPAGMGQLIKSLFLLKNYHQPLSKTTPIVIFERYHDVLALFSFLTLFSIIGNLMILRLPIFAIGILLLLSFMIMKSKKLLRIFQELSGRVRFLRMFKDKSSEFNNSLFLLSNKKSIFYGWLVSMVAWFFEAIGIFLCFQAFGLNISFSISSAFGFFSTLFGAISFIPGGAGVTEFIFVKLLSSHGIDLSIATALVIFYRICSLWYSTAIGIISTRFVLKMPSNYIHHD